MSMKILLTPLALLFWMTVSAQGKSATPIPLQKSKPNPQNPTQAIDVDISGHQDPAKLKY